MNIYRILPGLLVILMFSCKNKTEEKEETKAIAQTTIEIQGHRGDRGNFPENSLPAFISAVKKGVEVLELDVVISKDKKVIVSHEPYMSSLYVLTPQGDTIPRAKERTFNLYNMTYDSIKEFDAGSQGNRNFPEQQKIKTYKPLLAEVIDSVESFVSAEGLPRVKYNIELKSVEKDYNVYQPEPEEFIELVMEVLKSREIANRMNIQSFDVNILNAMNSKYPEIELSYLVSNKGIKKNLSQLNFTPEIYSPNFSLVENEEFVDSIKSMDMKLIPWTVNEPGDIKEMINLNVDGIITDYPERVIAELESK